MGTFIAICISLAIVKVKAVTGSIYSASDYLQNPYSALQHVYVVSPRKLGAILDVALQKDVDRKVARSIITVENTAYEESLKDLARVVCRKMRVDTKYKYTFVSECVGTIIKLVLVLCICQG